MHSPAPQQPKGTYALISLGCAKNLVDSERMAGLLGLDGYRMVAEPEGADFVVINTCGFIADARDESYLAIREMLRLKRRGRTGGVIVAGCLAERDRQTLLEKYPGIDQLVGVFARDQIGAAAERLSLRGSPPAADSLAEQRTLFCPAPTRPLEDTQRLRLTPRHLAFLKIAEGCNRACSFCSIPKIRGPYATKPIEQVVAEAEELVADGARELILVAQDTSYYGVEIDGRPRLAELLARLEQIDGLAWIRLMYLYPQHVTDELIAAVAAGKKVLPYLDLPLQHVNDDILSRMRRRVTRAETERLIERLRERIEGLVLRTTLIAGFPGETQQQFDELLEFVRRQRFERLGAFAYSEEPGTAAAELDGPVPEGVRACPPRADFGHPAGNRLRMEPIPGRPDAGRADRRRRAGPAQRLRRAQLCRCPGDRRRRLRDRPGLRPGEIVACEIVAARGYDLIAVPSEQGAS